MRTATKRTAGPRGRPRNPLAAAQRRESILVAAAHTFAARGYRRTDLQLVADTLGIGKGTVYRYFRSKEQLFLSAVDRGMRGLRAAVDANLSAVTDPLQRMALGVRTYLEYFDGHPELCELLIQERAEFKDRRTPTYFVHRETNVEPWRELFRRMIADERFRPMEVERVTEVIGDLLYGTMFTNYFTGRRPAPEEQARDILELVFEGIMTDQERARYRAQSCGGPEGRTADRGVNT